MENDGIKGDEGFEKMRAARRHDPSLSRNRVVDVRTKVRTLLRNSKNHEQSISANRWPNEKDSRLLSIREHTRATLAMG